MQDVFLGGNWKTRIPKHERNFVISVGWFWKIMQVRLNACRQYATIL